MSAPKALPAAAQAVLDEANALFPAVTPPRYRMTWQGASWEATDTQGSKIGGWIGNSAEALALALKVRTSARLSAHNGNRKYASRAEAPVQRCVSLLPAQWAVLEAQAEARGITLRELMAERLLA